VRIEEAARLELPDVAGRPSYFKKRYIRTAIKNIDKSIQVIRLGFFKFIFPPSELKNYFYLGPIRGERP
jgi:hypothetical protein